MCECVLLQIALHGYVNRAAALAGALVHAGHHSIAQASNLAEGAMDTAGVVRNSASS